MTRTSSRATPRATSNTLKISAGQSRRTEVGPHQFACKPKGKVFRIMAGPNGSIKGRRSEVGLHDAQRCGLDDDGITRRVVKLDLGQNDLAQKHRHTPRAETRRAAAIEVEWPGESTKARVELGGSPRERVGHAVAHDRRSSPM